jgi:hypothetical protein
MNKVQKALKVNLNDAAVTALPAAFNILEKWSCSQAEQMKLLGIISRSTLAKYKTKPETAKVSPDLMERMSYIFNIHKCLRILFDADDSTYGWVRKPNSHPFFAGRSAMDIMMQGRIQDLYNVTIRLNSWRGGKS